MHTQLNDLLKSYKVKTFNKTLVHLWRGWKLSLIVAQTLKVLGWCPEAFLAKLSPIVELLRQHAGIVSIAYPSGHKCALWGRDQAKKLKAIYSNMCRMQLAIILLKSKFEMVQEEWQETGRRMSPTYRYMVSVSLRTTNGVRLLEKWTFRTITSYYRPVWCDIKGSIPTLCWTSQNKSQLVVTKVYSPPARAVPN